MVQRSATDELHGRQSAQEKHRWDAKGMKRQPAHREDRIVAGCRGGRTGSHDGSVFKTGVQLGLALVTLAHHRCLDVSSLEVAIRTGSPEGVVSQPCADEEEPSQEDRRQCHCMDHPVTDARNDFEERTFPG